MPGGVLGAFSGGEKGPPAQPDRRRRTVRRARAHDLFCVGNCVRLDAGGDSVRHVHGLVAWDYRRISPAVHASLFVAVAPVRYALAALGSMSVQGPVIEWVGVHRRHHQHSDRPLDPHSPHAHDDEPHGTLTMLRGFYHALCRSTVLGHSRGLGRSGPACRSNRLACEPSVPLLGRDRAALPHAPWRRADVVVEGRFAWVSVGRVDADLSRTPSPGV